MPFDVQSLLKSLPFILGANNPAVAEGYRLYQEKKQKAQQQARAEELQRAQLGNIEGDNRRADEAAALNRLTAFRSAASDRATQIAETAQDPLQAQTGLTMDLAKMSGAYNVPPSAMAGTLPNMTAAISTRKKKQAQELYERAKSQFDPEDGTSDWEQSITLKTGELFGDTKPAQLRAIFEAPALTATGQPAVPASKQPRTSTEAERAQRLLGQIDAARVAGDAGAAAKFQRQYDNLLKASRELGRASGVPREPSARTVDTAREQAYQTVLAGGSMTVAARALRQAGLDPDVELGRIRRQIDGQVRELEARLPVDSDLGENRADPATYDQRLARARAMLRSGGTLGDRPTADPTALPATADPLLRDEAKRQLLGARQAAGDTRPVTEADIDVVLSRPGNADALRRQAGAPR